jgi:glycosyltransferase involved in cell wall biosynthesis
MLKKLKLQTKKILLLSWSDNYGGAAQSCYSIYKCLNKVNNKVNLFVQKKILKDSSIQTYPKITFNLFIRKVANFLMYNLRKTGTDHSYNLINSDILKISAANSYDIVNIHWFGSETLSIHDLTKIKSKVILTLHDMWAFCGSEHYLKKLPSEYFFHGQKKLVKKIDLLIWKWKFLLWKKKIPIIVPSNWLHQKLKQSKLMYNWPSIVIPYPVDQKIFKKKIYIKKYTGKFRILFVNAGKLLDERKGFDLLIQSLEKLRIPFILHVVGRIEKLDSIKTKITIKYHGYIKNKYMLAKIYNKMNVLALPSRIDNLPNVGLEAHSCGLPIVSFNIGGMSDIITHKKTGYLAKPYDVNDLARGIEFAKENSKILGVNALKKSKKWSYKLISEKYLKFINSRH